MTEHRQSDYTNEQIIELLTAGATVVGELTMQAAIHLVTFTELPRLAAFTRHVDVQDVLDIDRNPVTAAFVRDWRALLRDEEFTRMGGGDHRLLTLAVSLAAGEEISLRQQAIGLGTAHAKRVLEALAISLGVDRFYAITETPALTQMRAERERMFAS